MKLRKEDPNKIKYIKNHPEIYEYLIKNSSKDNVSRLKFLSICKDLSLLIFITIGLISYTRKKGLLKSQETFFKPYKSLFAWIYAGFMFRLYFNYSIPILIHKIIFETEKSNKNLTRYYFHVGLDYSNSNIHIKRYLEYIIDESFTNL